MFVWLLVSFHGNHLFVESMKKICFNLNTICLAPISLLCSWAFVCFVRFVLSFSIFFVHPLFDSFSHFRSFIRSITRLHTTVTFMRILQRWITSVVLVWPKSNVSMEIFLRVASTILIIQHYFSSLEIKTSHLNWVWCERFS